MDSYDIFKKLSIGAKFNFKKYQNDAIKLQMIKSNNNVSIENNVENKTNEEITDRESFNPIDNTHGSKSAKQKNDHKKQETITILGSIKSGQESNKKAKKKNKLTEKLLLQEQINHKRNVHKIHCQGKNIPDPIDTFEDLSTRYGLRLQLLKNISECGYELPTPIQMQTFPVMMQQSNLLATAPTGSGKTCAFLVPVIHHLTTAKSEEKHEKRRLRALIVCPTRELAKQTYRECLRLIIGTELRCHVLTKAQEKLGAKQSKNFDILISAPNRLVFYLKKENSEIKLDNLEWLIMDEADKLFEALNGERSFRNQLSYIYRECTTISGDKLKKAFFSATYKPEVSLWAAKSIKKLIRVTIGQRNGASELIDQKLKFVGSESGKLLALRQLIKKGIQPPVLIFVQSKERAKELCSELIYDGIRCDVIHADRPQQQRDNTVRAFREGKVWVLICTELLSRGIDFKGVNLVINYDLPPTLLTYIHRIGRTGRAGRPGQALTYFTEDDKNNLKHIIHVMKESGCKIPEYLEKRKFSKRRPEGTKVTERDSILTKPACEIEKEKRLMNKIKHAKEAKKLINGQK